MSYRLCTLGNAMIHFSIVDSHYILRITGCPINCITQHMDHMYEYYLQNSLFRTLCRSFPRTTSIDILVNPYVHMKLAFCVNQSFSHIVSSMMIAVNG